MQTRGRALPAVGTGRDGEKASVVRAQRGWEVWCDMSSEGSPEARSPGIGQDEVWVSTQGAAVGTLRAVGATRSETS